ncbi:MAG: c-type cytochrome [Gemmatimonas sp.]|nr:c-type cytochrome [Gemmatimonas sp.]
MNRLRRLAAWLEDRTGIWHALGPIAKHVVPRTGWAYVFGSATLVAFLIQVVTGITLTTVYVPSADEAYSSLEFITERATLGRLIRGMHFFGASAMVVLIGIHAVRVFLMGAFKFPREMNWLVGVGLLLLTLTIAFTGQLLRWDQNAIWSVVVGAEQAGRVPVIGTAIARFIIGGDFLGGATLSRFFALHVFVLPGLIFLFVGFHLFLVIRNGISEPPHAGEPVEPSTYRKSYAALLRREGVPFWPTAAWRDVVFATIVILAIVTLAAVIGPPALSKPPDPTIVDAYPRPDWYFLWYFAVLAMMPHWAESYLMVLGPLALIAVLIAIPLLFNRGERSPRRRPWAVGTVAFSGLVLTILTIAGNQSHWSPDFGVQPLPVHLIGTTSGPIYEGAQVFYSKGCLYCHRIEDHGGHRGPALTTIADRLTRREMTIRIMNGGYNMPGFAGNLAPAELDGIIEFLRSRTSEGATRARTPASMGPDTSAIGSR